MTLKLRAARAGVFRRAAALRAGAAELRNTSQRHLNVAAKEVSVTTTTILSPRAKIGHRPLTPTESPARPGSSNGPQSAFGGSSDEGAGVSERSTRPLVPALEHSNGGGSSLESITIVVPTSPGKASAPAAAASPAGVLRAVSSPERIAISLPGSFTRASSSKETSKQASPQADAGGGGGAAAAAAAAGAAAERRRRRRRRRPADGAAPVRAGGESDGEPGEPGGGGRLPPGQLHRERLPPAPLLERSGSAPLSGWPTAAAATSSGGAGGGAEARRRRRFRFRRPERSRGGGAAVDAAAVGDDDGVLGQRRRRADAALRRRAAHRLSAERFRRSETRPMMTDMMYDRWAARESAGRRAARCTSAATTTPAPHPPLVSLGLDLMTRSGDGRRERQGQQ